MSGAEIDHEARPKLRYSIHENNDHTLMWTTILYVDNPEPSMLSNLLGTSTVAKINVFRRPSEEDGSTVIFGDWAAYQGVCPGNISDSLAADYIARRGTKIGSDLAHHLFGARIKNVWGDQVRYRR